MIHSLKKQGGEHDEIQSAEDHAESVGAVPQAGDQLFRGAASGMVERIGRSDQRRTDHTGKGRSGDHRGNRNMERLEESRV